MPVLTPNQVISLHTLSGVNIFQFIPSDYMTLNWTRDQNNASGCTMGAPPVQGLDRLPDIAPWLHWLTVWNGDTSAVLWSGPIQKAVSSRRGMTLTAKDHAAYLPKTRDPMSKAWAHTDPAMIAEELWQQMIDLQGLKVTPLAKADPDQGTNGNKFDYTTVKDDKMLDQVISDLVNLGMIWTVVSGVPIIGPLLGREPLTALSDHDFMGLDDIQLIRDGTATFNDVMVKAEGSQVTRGVDYYGQRLQLLKNLDHLSSVSDVTAAASSYLRRFGAARTLLSMPGGAILTPDAGVTIDQLVPGARFILETQGVRQRMQLTLVEANRQAGESSIKVTMVSDFPAEELDAATNPAKPTVSAGSGAAATV